MGFMRAYKHLEKLCGDVMGDQRRISAYIEEMETMWMGSRYVPGWTADLKKLKHYRWVRNQIVHNPDCEEEHLCEPGDEEWLENFYDRIMEQTDPLTLYRRATQTQTAPRKLASEPEAVYRGPVMQKPRRKPVGCALLLGVCGIFAMLSMIMLLAF